MNYNFKSIPTVPGAKELIDIILSKTQRKTPTEVHPGFQISRIRKFYMRKVKYAQSCIEEKLQEFLDRFPKLEDIHPFYADLMNVLYDRDHYKLALGHINKAKALCESVAKDYVRMMKYSDSLYRAKTLKVAALGRMCTILKKLTNSLSYLDEVRKHLARLPSIDPHTRTLLITGYPNVGKSSFMNQLTHANVEVQPYAFTTKSLSVGHTDYDYVPWQVIDTPGLLDRPLTERNTVEMQAITALAHLHACILYFIDISEQCGYSIEQQLALFTSVQSLFVNKPIGFVLTKSDIVTYDSLPADKRQAIEATVQQANGFVTSLSNITGDGLQECKRMACERLKEFRGAIKSKGQKPILPNAPYISVPKLRDGVERPPVIPPAVIDEKTSGMKTVRGPTQKEIQELKGGAGVYSQPLMEHWDLENEDWRYDAPPEILDGKNIADFIDPDIMQKLEELEKEEAMLTDAHVPLDYDELRKTQRLIRRMFLRRRGIHMRSMLMKGHFEPRKKSEKQVKDGLEEVGIESSLVLERIEGRRKRPRSPDQGEEMEVDEEENLHKRMKTATQSLTKARSKGAKARVASTSIKELKWLKQGTAGVTDKRIPNMMPRHLYTGKRGIGKTERR